MEIDELEAKRVRSHGEEAREYAKKARLDDDTRTPSAKPSMEGGNLATIALTQLPPVSSNEEHQLIRPKYHDLPLPVSRLGLKPALPELPPSLELVTGVKTDLRLRKGFVGQEEVGIIGYAGPSQLKGVKGVIKQR